MHRRLFPVSYRFEYRVFTLLLDIDALDRLPRLISGARFNLFRFDPRTTAPRRLAAAPLGRAVLGERGIDLDGGRIRLLCFPRVLGYGFNPLSLWYCEHRDGSLRAVIAEVNNTFGEHHFYLLANDGGRSTGRCAARRPSASRLAADGHAGRLPLPAVASPPNTSRC
jgi:DUF1365 family protein